MITEQTQKNKFKTKNKPKYERYGDAPKSPYSDRQSNIDQAFDIIARKDKKSNSKIKRVEGKIQATSK